MISLENASRYFGSFCVLNVRRWPLGSGHSTMIRCINLSKKYGKGKIWVNGTELTEDGMTMIVVTQEIGFAKQAASKGIFMDQGELVEVVQGRTVFLQPIYDRTKPVLPQIVTH